jgi:DNA-binding transcriptional MerR regulator
MKFSSEYCISTGMFAQLCETTRETLRYYHKKGILVPRKQERNGYFYYSYAQIASFFFIRTFRELGCSVEDIQTYLLGGQQVEFDAFVDKQYHALLEERAEIERKISVIAGTRALLKEIRAADTRHPTLRTLPSELNLKLTPVRSRPATSASEIMPDILRHLAACQVPGVQAFPVGASIGVEDFLAERYSYQQVFSFAEEKIEAPDRLTLGGRTCAVFVCRDGDGEMAEHYREMANFLKECHYRPASDLYSLSMVNVIDPHETRRYLKYLFICVEPQGA